MGVAQQVGCQRRREEREVQAEGFSWVAPFLERAKVFLYGLPPTWYPKVMDAQL